MATDYEKEWPKLRIEWANEKIREWDDESKDPAAPLLNRKKRERDVELMRRALKDWEDR